MFTNTKAVPEHLGPEQVLLPRCFMHSREGKARDAFPSGTTPIHMAEADIHMQRHTNKSKYRRRTDLFMVALQHSPGTMSARSVQDFNPSEKVKMRCC